MKAPSFGWNKSADRKKFRQDKIDTQDKHIESPFVETTQVKSDTIGKGDTSEVDKKSQEEGQLKHLFQPRVVDKYEKLTIVLIENTGEVARQKDNLEKIVKSLVTTGYVCIINYGSSVRESEMFEAKSFDCSKLLCQEDIGDKACLFDALVALKSLVDKKYNIVKENQYTRIWVSGVDNIIGIGRCIDNCSTASRENGIEIFCEVAKSDNVVTKYFCLSEENFVEAATVGFHSIGAIARNYM